MLFEGSREEMQREGGRMLEQEQISRPLGEDHGAL